VTGHKGSRCAPYQSRVLHGFAVAGGGREETLRCGGEGAFLEARSAALALNSQQQQQPVKLTPSWEESNLPNEELNFRGVTMETADLEMNPPKDRSDIFQITFLYFFSLHFHH
jgi:hypothetical protein